MRPAANDAGGLAIVACGQVGLSLSELASMNSGMRVIGQVG